MDAAFALEVLDKAPYVTVSFTRSDGTPYGVPLSLARTDEKTFYFHCAMEGEKLDCIAANPMVALSAVGSHKMCTYRRPQGWQFHPTVQIGNGHRQGRNGDG